MESTPRGPPYQSERPHHPPHSRLSGPLSAPPVPAPYAAPRPPLQPVSSCCHCHHAEVCPSYQHQPWPDAVLPLGLSQHTTPLKATALPIQPKATPPRDYCTSPPHQAACTATNPAANPRAARVTPPRACCLSPPHQHGHGPMCVTDTPPSHGSWQCASQTNGHHSQPGAPLGQTLGLEGPHPDACSNVQMNMLPVDAYKLLMDQDRQLKLLQAQVSNK